MSPPCAGVSKSTVSLVLQRSPQVRAETRLAVERAMATSAMSTTAPRPISGLSSAELVGLVVNDLRDPFLTDFATSLQMTLAEAGHATIIASCDEDAELQGPAYRRD